MRKVVYNLLTTNADLNALLENPIWYTGSALDQAPAAPFGVFRFAGHPATFKRSGKHNLEIWVHDHRGSYTRIDDALEIIKDIFESVPAVFDGQYIAEADWTNDSPDLTNEDYNTNTRMASFDLVGRA